MRATIQQRVEELQKWIQSGRIIDAMNEFYAADVQMQENRNPPTMGLSANIEREKQFLAKVKEWKGYTVKTLCVGTDSSAVESVIEFVGHDNKSVRLEQVSVHHWKNGKIVHERFYYDSAA